MRRAFTLIELVLVVAIVVTLGAIAAPRYAAANVRYRADAAQRRVALDLAYARTTARSTGAAVTVTFDTLNHSYEISGVPGLRDSSDAYVVELDGAPYEALLATVALDAPLFVDDVNAIVFDAYGMPDGAGSVSFTAGAETRSVTIDESGVVTAGP